MEINWLKYKQIVLNDRTIWYRPNREIIAQLSKAFKDINIFGFGRYQETGCWYVLADSARFPENHLGCRVVVPISEVLIWSKPLLSIVTKTL